MGKVELALEKPQKLRPDELESLRRLLERIIDKLGAVLSREGRN
jgi:hypothetical protein